MTVSVLMITYNHEKFIREAMDGVLMQETDFNYELIIANDCSSDKTDEIIQEYVSTHPKRDRIKYYNHKTNIGMLPNFVFTIQHASGKYISLCEGDDYWTDKNKLQKQVDFLESNPDYTAVTANTMYLSNGELKHTYRESKELWLDVKYPSVLTYKDIACRVFPHTSTWLFRNIIHEFPKSYSGFFVADYPVFLMLSDIGKIKFVDEVVSVYRIHDAGAVGGFRKEDPKLMIAKFCHVLVEMDGHFKKKYLADTKFAIRKEIYRFVKENPSVENILFFSRLFQQCFKNLDDSGVSIVEKSRLIFSCIFGVKDLVKASTSSKIKQFVGK